MSQSSGTFQQQPAARRRASRLDENGTTAVEFALIAPALLLMLFGCMEFGRMLWTVGALNFAVEEAARCASVTPATCGTANQIASYAANEIAPAYIPASTYNASTQGCGHQVTATFAYPVLFTAVFSGAVGTTLNLTARACLS